MGRRKKDIVVSVVRKGDRRHLVYYWEDRVTGESGSSTAGTASRTQASRGVPAFIEEIRRRQKLATADVSWERFRARYEREHLRQRRPKTRAAWSTAANRFEEIVGPRRLADLNASSISQFRAALFGAVAPASLNSYLRSLRAASRWGAKIFVGYKAPEIAVEKPGVGGRPLVGEEFDRMLAACEAVMGHQYAGSWRFLIRGLAWSGLRLGQALDLSWEPDASIYVTNLDGRHPLVAIRAAAHKGGKDKSVPLVPPMVALLRQVPPQQRTGYVFNPRTRRGISRNVNSASAILSRIGQRAGIVTGSRLLRRKNARTGKMEVVGEGPRFAGAHDLKRTFMDRLVEVGMHPADAARFAQHEDFDTSFRHYTTRDAERLSERAEGLFRQAQEE